MKHSADAHSTGAPPPAANRSVSRQWVGCYLDPVPAERLATVRMLVGAFAVAYLLVHLPHLLSVARFGDPLESTGSADPRFDPVGPLWFLDSAVSPLLAQVVITVTIASGFAFVAGWRWRLTGPLFAVLFLAVTTYRNSWGQVFHTENLVALHLIVLAVSPAAATWSLDRRRQDDNNTSTATGISGWPLRLCSVVTVLAYAVSGWAKLRNGGFNWISGDVLRNQVAHDNLRKALMGDVYSPIAARLVGHGWVFPPMALFAVVVELGAPLALLAWHRLRVVWAVSAWLFHVEIGRAHV